MKVKELQNRIVLSLLSIALVASVVIISVSSFPSPSTYNKNPNRHGIRIQPEIDKINVDEYLSNHKAMKLQIECVIRDAPCDFVGRWLKPRIASALIGECLLCTEKQKTQLPKIVNFIQTHYPKEFKLGVKKYLISFGIEIPDEKPSTNKEEDETPETQTITKPEQNETKVETEEITTLKP